MDVDAAARSVLGATVEVEGEPQPPRHAARAPSSRPASTIGGPHGRRGCCSCRCRNVMVGVRPSTLMGVGPGCQRLWSDLSRTFVTVLLTSSPLAGYESQTRLVDGCDTGVADLDQTGVTQLPEVSADHLAHRADRGGQVSLVN